MIINSLEIIDLPCSSNTDDDNVVEWEVTIAVGDDEEWSIEEVNGFGRITSNPNNVNPNIFFNSIAAATNDSTTKKRKDS